MLTALKRLWRLQRYRAHGVVPDRIVPTERHGQGGGEWTICPDGLGPAGIVYSFGIGRDISFDLSLAGRFGCAVHCFDPTPVSLEWVRQQALPPQIHVHPYGLADYDGTLAFRPPRKSRSAHFTPVQRYHEEASERVHAPVRRLATIARELGHKRIDILKIDIEGGEYAALPDILAAGLDIGQILVEFHHCYATIPLARTIESVNLLRRHGYALIHISPRTYELSFLKG